MRYLSICSGIEAATVAWHPLGWQAVAYSEIEPFPCAVLAHHYPTIQNFGDMTQFKEWDSERLHSIDVLAGGTPCQSFSVAGLRQGLSDPRGNLMLTYLGIAEKFKPQWIVWENVPGVLSSNRGRDFGTFLGALAKLGYGWAFRVLDAQWFRLAQRRRRVFVVGCLGDTRRAAKVLFEPESVRRNTPPDRIAQQSLAKCITSRIGSGVFDLDLHEAPIVIHGTQDPCVSDITFAQGRNDGRENVICLMDQGGSRMEVENNLTGTLRRESHGHEPVVAFAQNQMGEVRTSNVFNTINTNSNASGRNTPMVAQALQVRRLTPRECERLQGFPDDYTAIPWRRKPADQCPDGPRYKALGNSMAVPVMRWIGKRIGELNTGDDNG